MLQIPLPTGFQGNVLCHVMPWFSRTAKTNFHPCLAYNSEDPITVGRQLTVMQAWGVKGVIMTYQGPFGGGNSHACAMEFLRQCESREMLFTILCDPWIAKSGTGTTPEAKITAALNHPDVLKMFASPAYLPEGYLLDFNTGVTWSNVNVPLFKGGARPVLGLASGFAWSHDDGLMDPITSLKQQMAKPTMKVGALTMSFFDGGTPIVNTGYPKDLVTGSNLDFNKQNWGTGGTTRYSPDRAGNYFFDQLAATPATLPYIALLTWNDYNERTAWEPWLSVLAGKRIY